MGGYYVRTKGTYRKGSSFGSEKMEKKIENPFKNKSDFGWHWEQNVYTRKSVLRAEKAGGGTGNIPKVIRRWKRKS